MFKEVGIAFFATWFIFVVVPILAVWTIGLPLMDTWFWFSSLHTSTCIAWGWFVAIVMLLLLTELKGTD